MDTIKWFDRKFDFDFTENIFPLILERLKGTPIRLNHKVSLIPIEFLNIRLANTWSVKENIGHLTDLEPLWQQRFRDILDGVEYMTPADLTNSRTDQANHNSQSPSHLLHEFSTVRNQTLAMLENIEERFIFKSSLHPRLKTPMRTMDLFLFVAEHDDHHLARITSIVKGLQKAV